MKQRIIILFSIFIYFILVFCLGKILFTNICSTIEDSLSLREIKDILYHGLPLDMSVSGYLTVIPAIFLIMSIWIDPKTTTRLNDLYFILISIIIAIIIISDIALYPYWGFHFDSAIFLYLKKPKEAFASASTHQIVIGIVIFILFAFLLYITYYYSIRKWISRLTIPKNKAFSTIVLLLLTSTLFLPIRGGISVSTMNIGKAYFSDKMFLNHAAINPAFNLMASFTKSDDFGSQYQFYSKSEADNIFDSMMKIKQPCDSITNVLTTNTPNIILFILESFSAEVISDSITPNFNKLKEEGIFFTNFYANSFRTDRGLVSILSGYPAQPTVAIMKYPKKANSLPAISKNLLGAGYKDMAFYYGGDIDFANMRSYIVGTCGIKNIISDKNFPINQRMNKWGAPDKYLFEKLSNDLINNKPENPFFNVALTLSSHEPFDVPVNKFDNPYLNAVNYTDSCLGNFVDSFRKSPLWENTLLIFVADHGMQSYPAMANNSDVNRFHIPMLWAGGVIKQPAIVKTYGSQNDIAATLLAQLKINYCNFRFSKDMLSDCTQQFSFYSYMNGFSLTDSTGTVTYDNEKREVIHQSGNHNLEQKAKAFFQTMYNDLGSR